MTILITGGAGFIGSHLAESLLADGHSVAVLDDLSTGRRENLAAVMDHPKFTFVQGCVTDRAVMHSLAETCDQIYHLAAAVGVQLIVDEPAHTIKTNIHGTEVALEVAREHNCRLLIASTSEVYGKNTTVPFCEEDDTTLGSTKFSRWSYAASKMIDEFLAMAYRQQYSLDVVCCRLFNTIGPRQSGEYGMVVPRFVHSAIAGEPITVYGTGEQSRCFCHVADVIGALTQLMSCDAAMGQVVNVGCDESITMNQLAQRVIERTGSASEVRHISYEQAYGRPFDDMLIRCPSLERVGGLIGWQASRTLDETLDDIIQSLR